MLLCDNGFMSPILATVGSGIKSVADLKGKKMAGWSRSSIFGKAALMAALEVYGLSEKDVNFIEGKSTGEVKRMIQEGMVEAASLPMTPNSSAIVDLMANRPSIFIPIPREKVEQIVKICLEKYKTMVSPMTLPANSYQGQTQDLYYPGAVKYFKERGWWTQEMETKQQKALIEMAELLRQYGDK